MFGFQTRREMQRLNGLLRKTREERLTRRMSGMLPPSGIPGATVRGRAKTINFRSLLLAFEGNRSTCCINISSPKEMSRAAIILFRGRILACAHGRRGLPYYVYGPEAYESIIIDMAHPDAEFNVQAMSEEEAVASASIFQGQYKVQPDRATLERFFDDAYRAISNSKHPGCILLKDSDEKTRCIIQMFDGAPIRVYSHQSGWMSDSPEKLLKRLRRQLRGDKLKAQAFMLTASTLEDLFALTFSPSNVPTSISDKQTWIAEMSAKDPLSPIFLHSQAVPLRDTFKFSKLAPSEEHQLEIENLISYAVREAQSRHAHMVDPWK